MTKLVPGHTEHDYYIAHSPMTSQVQRDLGPSDCLIRLEYSDSAGPSIQSISTTSGYICGPEKSLQMCFLGCWVRDGTVICRNNDAGGRYKRPGNCMTSPGMRVILLFAPAVDYLTDSRDAHTSVVGAPCAAIAAWKIRCATCAYATSAARTRKDARLAP